MMTLFDVSLSKSLFLCAYLYCVVCVQLWIVRSDLENLGLRSHAILIEWLRLKINFLTFNLNHLIKNC
jgi:hypothetical protein